MRHKRSEHIESSFHRFSHLRADSIKRSGPPIRCRINAFYVEDIRHRRPIVYQESAGGRNELSGNYVLNDENEVTFQVASYDPNKPLIFTILTILRFSWT
jgi:hypothetical protein